MTKSYLHLVEVGMLTSILIIFTINFIIISITFIQTIVNIILLTITKLPAGGDLHHVQEEQTDKATNLSD